MLSFTSILLLGFVLGMRHATDPDHVVAVTTIVSDERSLWRASAIGAVWGVGHSITILAVGGAIVVFRLVIPPRLGLLLEFCVAVMLILLGMLTLSGRRVGSATNMARPLVVGIVHGLAGSAFVALLVLAAVPGAMLQLLYLALFAAGTIAGMGRDHDGGRASIGRDGAPLRARAGIFACGERSGESRLRGRARSARRLTGIVRRGTALDAAVTSGAAARREFSRRLRRWYTRNARDLPWRRTRDPYEVLVSELMLQQTQVSRVVTRYGEFLERFPTLHDVARATPSASHGGVGRTRLLRPSAQPAPACARR